MTNSKWSVVNGVLFKGPNGVSVWTDVRGLTPVQIDLVIAELELRGHWCMSRCDVNGTIRVQL